MALVFIACEKTPTQPTPAGCTITLSPSSLSFGANGGSSSVAVSAPSACAWTATSDRGWMSITSGANGTGAGTVSVDVAANAAAAERSGTLTIAGQAVPVRQDAVSCEVTIDPESAAVGKDEAAASFAVRTTDACAWTAASHAAWLTIVSGSAGTGNGTVSYTIARNRDLTSRTATIGVADQVFTLTQAGDSPTPPICEYSVRPVEFTPCMRSSTMSALVTTQQGCPWTASPGASWIAVTSGPAGNGPGTVTFSVADNWDAPRHGVVEVRWPTVTAGQNLQIQQAGCTYAVSTHAISIAAAGGTAQFDVLQESDPNTCGGPLQNACMWTAQADVSWITVMTSMPQVGDNRVSFSVAANGGTAARTGTITVRNQTVTVTQAGR